jgi:glutathione-regulated potassium-efflux system ancillary protein KefF
MICLLYAHPYPDRSRANRALLNAVRGVDQLEVRRLYDLYPDFSIDVHAEHEALTRAQLIVLQHPLYWYSVPGLLKHWFDKVLTVGWAYGNGGDALRGKHCWWVATTGALGSGYEKAGIHMRPFADFVPPIEQTARFCGMHWLEPLIVHGAHRIDDDALNEQAERYRERLVELAAKAAQASR